VGSGEKAIEMQGRGRGETTFCCCRDLGVAKRGFRGRAVEGAFGEFRV
jgi:hypothetical protein